MADVSVEVVEEQFTERFIGPIQKFLLCGQNLV